MRDTSSEMRKAKSRCEIRVNEIRKAKSGCGIRVNEMRKAKSGGERPKHNSEFIKQEEGGKLLF
ncbi:hypothetical protein A6E08_13010 [Vibrio lentus]|nr:hypothetical protein A6E08_13010 [Vibrio lentus]